MLLKLITAILVSLVLLAATGCTGGPSFNIRGLLPRADIPNATEQPPADDTAAQAEPETATQPVPGTETREARESAPPPEPARNAASNTATQTTASTTPAAPRQSGGAISFTPVIGAPVDAVQPLSRQLGSAARVHGLTILQSASGDSDHILKGYFSASTDGDKTTISFVWDVLDSQGNRLHRISGQEIAQGTASDPWEVVQDSTMETIATTTIDQYVAWRSSSGS